MDGKQLLSWQDPQTGIVFRAGTRQRGDSVQVYLDLNDAGKLNSLVVADRVDLHHLILLRHDVWLLVLSGPYVLGGYNYDTGKIVGMNSGSLPYTLRTNSGDPVASVQLDDGNDTPPFGFQERRDR